MRDIANPIQMEPRRASVRDLEQLVLSRIARGEYPTGSRLPTCAALGRELGANKNTISKVYQSLARKGYTVSSPGRGTFVAKRPSPSWGDGRAAEARKLVGDAVAQASLFGLTAVELEDLAIDAVRSHFSRHQLRVGYVDCNRAEARELAKDLVQMLAIDVEPLVVSDVGSSDSSAIWDLLAVNLAHLRAVERRVRHASAARTMLMPVVSLPDASTLTQVARLPAGTRLLVVSDTEEVLHTLTGMARGVNPVASVSSILSTSAHLHDALGGTDWVLVTRTAHRRLRAQLDETRTIVAAFKLDEQSLSDLAGRVVALQHSKRTNQVKPDNSNRRPGRQQAAGSTQPAATEAPGEGSRE